MLLVFYPFDFSPVCSDQLSVYQEVKPEIAAKGVEMVGISIDHIHAHKAFQEKLGIDIALLADFEPKGEVAKAYGAYFEERGHANRSLVLVDEEGTVEWVHESPAAAGGSRRQPDLRRAGVGRGLTAELTSAAGAATRPRGPCAGRGGCR